MERAGDDRGPDKSFQSYPDVVKDAFTDAHLSYSSVELINIGHDELMGNDGKMLIGRSANLAAMKDVVVGCCAQNWWES